MKRKYMRPALRVVRIEQTRIICGSGDWDVIPPDEPNTPAGAPRFRGIWDDDWDEEW